MRKSTDIKAEKLAAIEEANELLAKIGEGNFTEEEKTRCDELTDEGGIINKLGDEFDEAVKAEEKKAAQMARIAKWQDELKDAGQQRSASTGVVKPAESTPQPNLRGARSRFFSDPKDAYLSGQYFKAAILGDDEARSELRKYGWERYASQTEGTGSKGGYLVPEQMQTEVLKYRDEVGVAMRVARVFSMTTDTLTIPEETSRPTVYYPGEGGTITASEAAFARNKLIVSKRAALVKLTRELIADAAISAADYLVETMGYEMAYAMDNELLNGDGTSTYGGEMGLINAIGSAGVNDADTGEDTLAELDVQDWTDTIGTLPGKYQYGGMPAWIVSRETWNGSILPLSVGAGGNTVQNMQNGLGGFQWLGYPVYVSDLMPAAAASTIVALFGNFMKGVAIGDRGDLSFETSTERYFETDEIGIRVCHRYDILVHNPGDSSNAGAYVALKTAA